MSVAAPYSMATLARGNNQMGSRRKVHQANRRFEFGVDHAIPEHPVPMYELDTYGRVGDSLSHSADRESDNSDVEVFARVLVRRGRVVIEPV